MRPVRGQAQPTLDDEPHGSLLERGVRLVAISIVSSGNATAKSRAIACGVRVPTRAKLRARRRRLHAKEERRWSRGLVGLALRGREL